MAIEGVEQFWVIPITGHIGFLFLDFLRISALLKSNHVLEFSFTRALFSEL